VKRYVDEPGSVRVRKLLGLAAAATSRLSEVEIASALARRCREGTLGRPNLDRALAALHADISSIALVELVTEVTQTAIALLSRHPLRTGDSIQLASCMYLRRRITEDVRLLAYDERLNDAARAEGLPLAPPD